MTEGLLALKSHDTIDMDGGIIGTKKLYFINLKLEASSDITTLTLLL